MPNPLTGDFEAVLQVSGGTVNRLLASMHQNAWSTTDLPSFPHSMGLRLGEPTPLDGVVGTLQMQISVPRIELLHGATDRFRLEVGIRARYRRDPGTEPLPEFIHGTVRAEYRIVDIDPNCFGWGARASNYLWIRVVRESVQFEGTTADSRGVVEAAIEVDVAARAAVEQANKLKITRQIARLLATVFEPTPHPVGTRFRRGSMRSLSAPIGGSAVAVPIGLSGEPVGQIASVDNVLLEGADLAIGVSIGCVLSGAEPALAAIRGFSPTVYVHVSTGEWNPIPDFDTVYRVRVDPPTVEWHPRGSDAVIKIKVHGSAETDSIAPNASFDIDQDVILWFDAGAERLFLSRGPVHVSAHASGPFGGLVEDAVEDGITKNVRSTVDAACAQAQPFLDTMLAGKKGLIDQLRTIDNQANARVDQAVFLLDGIILRGRISLAARRPPVTTFETTPAKDGHTARESWIPGGRIDRFEWSWSWVGTGDPGVAAHDDRFVLRRPRGKVGKWGVSLAASTPLPGIDGMGVVCLTIVGAQVDAVTGELVPVRSAARCRRFGFRLYTNPREGIGRLFVPDVPEVAKDVPFPQLGVTEVGRAHLAAPAANTLVIYVDEAWDAEIAATLERGLEGCGREDAGLLLLALFRDGLLGSTSSQTVREVHEFAREIGIPTLVTEDVHGGWAAVLGLRTGSGQPGWRLLSPWGGATWGHEGRLDPDRLAAALDHHLIPSAAPALGEIHPGIGIGDKLGEIALSPDPDLEGTHCPPLSLGRLGIVAGSVVSFVQAGSAASEATLRQLAVRYPQHDEGAPLVVVVVDGADAHEVEAMQNELGVDFTTLADPTGTITDRFGVGMWPTTVALDHTGTVSAVEAGAAAAAHDHGPSRESRGESA